MRIEHIALWVRDLETMKFFYEKYFSAQPNDKYLNKSKGFSSYFLAFDSGARIELMHRPDVLSSDRQGSMIYGLAHFAISLGGKAQVDALTERLQADGYQIVGQPRTTGDGYYESVIKDPEGNLIELTI